MLQRWLQRLMVTVFTIVLVACGGGGGGNSASSTPSMAVEPTLNTKSPDVVVQAVTLDYRPLSSGTSSLAWTEADISKFAGWLEDWDAATAYGFFPKGPTTQRGTFSGREFFYREYPLAGGQTTWLGVRDDLAVFVHFPSRSLQQFGTLADYASVVLGSGGGTGKAGVFDVSAAMQRLVPDLVDGKLTYLGAEDKETYKPTPAEVTKTCWVSHRRGWFDKNKPELIPAGCTTPAVDGTLALAGMCNNDRGQLVLLAGRKLWPSFTDPKGWKLAGDLNPKLVGDFVEYGGYQPSVVSYDKATGELTVDFGADCMTGFNQPLTPGPLDFRFESDVEGWGKDTKRRHWLEWDGKKHFTKIAGIACGQRGQVSVYKPKTLNADGTVKEWEDTAYAWFNVPPDGEANPQWQKGVGVEWYNGPPLIHQPNGEHSISLGC